LAGKQNAIATTRDHVREERGQISGDVTIAEPYTLWGTVGGDVRVVDGGKLWARGSIYGNLDVATGGRVHVYGNISGDLTVQKGAKVILSGRIMGDAINRGGRLFVEASGMVMGKIKTKSGETKVEPKPGAWKVE
jgi:cytoskeletal protein CcmA (bactofilin family)